ncbi:MAG: thioredoxin [Bacteroidaceae bacterium]|nr:thioredoxin [Bacteroidaceae bacterium]MBR4242741.1 thioredoxin [Bacteroidaceae bacterium]
MLAITDATFNDLLAQGKPMVVDFWATWCGPCRKVGPYIEQLAEKYDGQVIVGKVDVDENDELAVQFRIQSIPTILFIKDGEVVDRQVGAAPLAMLEEKLQKLL